MFRPLRSLLFVPAIRADRFAKAFASGADAVVIDLEDAVPADRKAEARAIVGEWLAGASASRTARFIRVNAPGSPWLDEDLAWLRLLAAEFDAIVVPKVETAEAIEQVAEAGPTDHVIPLLETVRGVSNADAVTAAKVSVPAVLFGAEDLTAELGVPRTLDGEELLYARSRVVFAAAAAGAEAIDAVWTDLTSSDGLRKDALRARALGFRGKMAIHPCQGPVINDVFTPSPEEIAAAKRLVEADEQARAQGDGVFRLDDRMVDAPVIKRARRILAIAESLG